MGVVGWNFCFNGSQQKHEVIIKICPRPGKPPTHYNVSPYICSISLGMDKQQEYMASQADEEAEEVVVNNTESLSDVESSGVALEELTPDKVSHQGEK